MAGVGGLGVPGQLAHRQPVAVGGEQRHLLAVDLDPDTGEDRQGVAAVGRDGDLRDGLGEDVAGDGAGRRRGGGQGRVVLGRHHQQAEARRPAGDGHLVALGADVDRPVGQVAGDLGEQAAQDEHLAGLGDLGGHGDLGRDLVVERREGQAALLVGLDEHAGENGDRRTCRQASGHPGHGIGENLTFDPELHRRNRPSGSMQTRRNNIIVMRH